MDYEQKTFKLSTKFFDNRKTQIILGMEKGATYIVIWLKLLALAGQRDYHGSLYVTEDVPYTPNELSIVLREPVDDIVKALYFFKKYSMVLISDDGVITIKNWDKYQNPEEEEYDEEEYEDLPEDQEETEIERKRRLAAERKRRQRARENESCDLCHADVTLMSRDCHADVTQESVTCHADVTQQGSLPPTPPNSPKVYNINNNNNISPSQDNGEDTEDKNKGCGEKEPKRKVFVKPTEEEVDAYCAERKNGIKGAAFIDYYDSVGWVVGTSKKPMKDWKAAVRQWERKNDESVVNSNQINRGNHTRDSCQPRTAYDLKPRFAGHKYDADGNDITGE